MSIEELHSLSVGRARPPEVARRHCLRARVATSRLNTHEVPRPAYAYYGVLIYRMWDWRSASANAACGGHGDDDERVRGRLGPKGHGCWACRIAGNGGRSHGGLRG